MTEWQDSNSDSWNNPWSQEWQDSNDGGWLQIGAVSKAPKPREAPPPIKITNAFTELQDKQTTVETPITDLIKEKHTQKPKTKKMSKTKIAVDKSRQLITITDLDNIDREIAEHLEHMKPEDCSMNRKDGRAGRRSMAPGLLQRAWTQAHKGEENCNTNECQCRPIAGLTVMQDGIAACAQADGGWRKLSMAVDSGACESVIDAEEEVPGYEIKETRASKSGLTYASATGEEIPNLGEVVVPMLTRENTKRSMKLQAATVTRALASVKRICEAGHAVVFDQACSFTFNKETGEVNSLREEGGNYMLDVWVPPPEDTTFGRRR